MTGIRMAREFEIHFDVEMRHGSLIQGDEQQKRDTTWWTDIYKQKSAQFLLGEIQKIHWFFSAAGRGENH